MLDYVVEHAKPLKAYLGDEEHTFDLDVFALSSQEWRCAKQLRKVLKPLKQATLFFSRDETPHLATVIPAMDRLDTELATFCIDNSLEPAIRAAAKLAKSTLNRYYSLTDESDVYRIAMVLHPRHKLQYFRKQGWEDAWVTAAEIITRTTWEDEY
ncbi:hypothetical protein K525DRAFT_180728, partial [Schizophyllum commune Loenen D]